LLKRADARKLRGSADIISVYMTHIAILARQA